MDAELCLDDAEKSCIEYLKEDGMADEEIEDEVAIIRYVSLDQSLTVDPAIFKLFKYYIYNS